jgi:hypothetical protein
MRFVIFAHFHPSIPSRGVVAISPLFHFQRKGKISPTRARAIFHASTACFQTFISICRCPPPRYKNLKKIQEVTNHYGYFKKNSILSVKNLIFGNAAKIGFLHKLLSRVSKLLVGTVCNRLLRRFYFKIFGIEASPYLL